MVMDNARIHMAEEAEVFTNLLLRSIVVDGRPIHMMITLFNLLACQLNHRSRI
jgi:hypothetical protein